MIKFIGRNLWLMWLVCLGVILGFEYDDTRFWLFAIPMIVFVEASYFYRLQERMDEWIDHSSQLLEVILKEVNSQSEEK